MPVLIRSFRSPGLMVERPTNLLIIIGLSAQNLPDCVICIQLEHKVVASNMWPVQVADHNINKQQKFNSLPKLYSEIQRFELGPWFGISGENFARDVGFSAKLSVQGKLLGPILCTSKFPAHLCLIKKFFLSRVTPVCLRPSVAVIAGSCRKLM